MLSKFHWGLLINFQSDINVFIRMLVLCEKSLDAIASLDFSTFYGTQIDELFIGRKFINSYWIDGLFRGRKYINSYWIDGLFRVEEVH